MEGQQHKKVLIVSYFFPPANTIGAVRVGKFAKYLQDFGWEPWVLTLEKGVLNLSEDLPVEISEAHVVRAGFGRIFAAIARKRRAQRPALPAPATSPEITHRRPGIAHLLWSKLTATVTDARIPDRALPWYGPAIALGEKLLARERFDAILSSNGPPGSAVVASVLSKRHGIPWVADFRDLWTLNHGYQGRPRIVHWVEQEFEKRIMRHCVEMVTVSEPLRVQLAALHKKKVALITNGFDEAEYPAGPPHVSGSTFRIVYTGMIYEGKQDPAPFVAAIAELIRRGVIARSALSVEFYGTASSSLAQSVSRHGVEDVVRMMPRITHAESRARQMDADVLLLLDWSDSAIKGYLSAKVFEYFGAKRPVLAVGPSGSAIEALLVETKAGVLAYTQHDIELILTAWITKWKEAGAVPFTPDPAAVSRYTRREQSRALAGILDAAVQGTMLL